MRSDLGRAVLFGRDASAYDRARPDYPVASVDHIMGLTDISRVVEVGAGTGLATALFAARHLEIACPEPSSTMADILRSKALPGVQVEVTTFEDWRGESAPVDLVLAAQSWHWVDHSTAYERARNALRTGGVLALMWNVPIDRYGRLVDTYRALGPEILAEDDERIGRRDGEAWLDELKAGGFREANLSSEVWSTDMGPAEFRQLCSTYSDHIMISEPRRTALLDALELAVQDRGGSIRIEYETRVFSGVNP